MRRIAEEDGVRVVILQLFNVHSIDASICLALRQTHRFLEKTNRSLMITGIAKPIMKVLQQSGVDKELGKENLFPANKRVPAEPTRAAYALAKKQL